MQGQQETTSKDAQITRVSANEKYAVRILNPNYKKSLEISADTLASSMASQTATCKKARNFSIEQDSYMNLLTGANQIHKPKTRLSDDIMIESFINSALDEDCTLTLQKYEKSNNNIRKKML